MKRIILILILSLPSFFAESQNTGFFNEYVPNLQQYGQQTFYVDDPNILIGGNTFAVTTQAATVLETDTNGNFKTMWTLTAPSIELYRCRKYDANNCIITGTMASSCGVSGYGYVGSFNFTTGTWNGGYSYNCGAQLGGFCNGMYFATDGIALANGDIASTGYMDQTVTCCLGASTLGTYNCGVGSLGTGGVGYLDQFFGTGSYERGQDICLIRSGLNGDTGTAAGGDGFVRKYSLAYSGGGGCGYSGPVQPTPIAHTTGTFNYISNPTWVGDSTRNDYPYSVVEDANHNIFVCGYTENYSSNSDYEGFILKVNSAGATQWCRTFYLGSASTAYEEIINMAFVTEDGSNDLVCTMQSYQSDNTELLRVANTTGNIVWANSYSMGTQTIPFGIHLTTNKTSLGYNEYLVGITGVNFPGAPGSYNMCMMIVDDHGNFISAVGEGISPQDGDNWCPDVDQASPGSYYISGNTPYTGGMTDGSLVAKINREYNTTGCATYEFPVTVAVTPRVIGGGNAMRSRAPVIYEVRGGATETAFTPTVAAVTPFVPSINCTCAPLVVSASATTPSICTGGNTNINASGATNYTWSPSTGLSATTGATVNAAPTSTITYTVTGSNLGGCGPGTATVVVTVNSAPTISITPGGSTSLCPGGNVSFTANGAGGGGSYAWSPATGLSATSGATVTATPGSTQTYTVTGTTAGGCSSTASVTVTINPTPTVTASATPPAICSGSSTTLNSGGAGGGGTYTWGPSTGLVVTTGSSITANPASSITYTVTGTTGAGCTSTQTVSVTVNPLPVVSIAITGVSPAVCAGDTVGMLASGAGAGGTYTWSPATGLSATSGAHVIANPGATTTYTVTGLNTNGCSSTATQIITIFPIPTITVSPTSASVCSGTPTTLSAGGGTVYTWSPSTGLSATTGASVSATPSVTTVYTVIGANGSGCKDSAKATITVTPTPTVNITPLSPAICPGGNVNLTASGASGYTWTPSTALSATTGAIVNSAPASTITYTVTGNNATCTSTQTVVVTVASSLNITVNPTTPAICKGDSITLNASGGATYTWRPSSGLSCSTCPSPKAGPSVNTTYTVVGASGSCADSTNVTVSINPSPTVSVTPPSPTICAGSNVVLIASGGTSYTWSPSGSLSASTGSNVTATPATSTTYTVVGTNGSGCTDTVTVSITVTPPPTVGVIITGISPAVCAGDTVGMIANGASTYTWLPATGLNVTTGAYVIANPATTTTYTVTGTTAGGCSSTATQVITIYPTPTISVTPASPAICAGTSTIINASGASNYVWSPATGLNVTTGSSVTDSSMTTQTYTVVGTTAKGCKDTVTATVTVTPLPAVKVVPANPTICSGGNVNLIASGATTYAWGPPGGLSAITGDSVNATPSATTTYTVTGTAGFCSDTQSVVVTVATSLNVTVTPSSPSLCTGDSVSLSAGGAASFVWSPALGLSCSTCPNPVATPTVTTTYKILGSSGSCADSTNVTITVNPVPVVTASAANPAICNGSSAILTATGATNYVWSPSATLSASTGSILSATPSAAITYTVVGSNLGGCSDSAVVSINVNVTPTVTISSSGSDSICNGHSVTLTANGGAGTYTWSNGATTSSITVTPGSAITYSVLASNGTCADSATQPVYVYPPFIVTMHSDSICAGNNAIVTANVSGGEPAYTYSWSNGTTGVNAITVAPAGNTYYACTVTDGCGDNTTDSAMVFTFTAPKALFTPTPDTVVGGTYVSFVNKSTNATSYVWSFSNESGSTQFQPYILYSVPGDYIVTLYASNGGCRDSLTDTVFVTETIYIPNVFTPNGDGVNDVFHVTMGGMKYYHVEIFNRWGEKVFISDSPQIDWDGRSTAGVDESDGTYYYMINATDYAGKQYNYDGYLQLIR